MARRMWGLGLVAVVAAITGVAACRQLVGITDNPPQDLVTSICGLPYGTNVCASCVNTSCCTESNTCAADPICLPYESCLGVCKGDPTCRSQCVVDQSAGMTPAVPALSACIAENCPNECGLVCGGASAYLSLPDAAVACQTCMTTNACPSELACAASEDCSAALQQCAQGCATFDCAVDCQQGHGAIAPRSVASQGLWLPIVTALRGSCIDDCATGNDWSCVGHRHWPDTEAQDITLAFVAREYVGNGPVADLNVSVCGTDPTCAIPLQTGSTGTDGTAVLKFVGPGTAAQGLNSFLQVVSPAMAYVPTLVYWGFPLSEATVTIPWSFATPAEDQSLGSQVTQDPSRAQIVAYLGDCLFNASPGVQVSTDISDPEMKEFYGLNLPTPTATDTTGIVFFDNVPVGDDVHLTATPLALGKPSSKVTVQVRAGWITGVQMYPTP